MAIKRRIATEEAFAIPEQFKAYRELGSKMGYHPDLQLWNSILGKDASYPSDLEDWLLDLDDRRLRVMDEFGIDMHVLSMTSPGAQILDTDKGTALARLANDRLVEIIKQHPDRYAGLASIAPQDPKAAVKEIDRAINKLKLNGLIINSHTNGEYLDEEKYWPILEAASALKVPLYIHPRGPSPGLQEPFRKYHLETAIWGYQVETGTHGVRLIMSGVFDRFPDLKIILGHMGEGIPYWLWRIDYMHNSYGYHSRPKLKHKPSDYFKQNFMITTSGMNWQPVLQFCQEILGPDNIMFAVDYPYQQTEGSVRFMDSASLSDRDKNKIYHLNAERVFGL